MKITICGSSAFKEKKVEIKKELEKIGHEVMLHPHYEAFARGEKQELWSQIQREHHKAKIENNYIKWYYDAISKSDAILVLNLDKKGVKNYIGGNVLIEMGFAHVLNKKIFLYNPLPEDSPYIDEIKAMYNKIINGNLNKIE